MSAEQHTAPGETSLEDAAKTLDQIRMAQAKQLGRMLALFVLLPTAATLVFDLAIASKQYEAQTTITLDAGVGSEPATVGSPLARDVMMLETFLTSRALVTELTRQHGLREHYTGASLDPFSRLGDDASQEALYDHFRAHMDADFDPERAFIDIRVRAYSGAEAERIAKAVVTVASSHVEALVTARRHDALANARRDADEAAVELGRARAALAALPADASVATDAGVVVDGGVAAPAPSVEREQARAKVELAEGRFEATAHALDEARAAASRLERRTVVVVEAARPDVASLPRPLRDTFTVFLGSLAVLVIGSIVISTIKEHV